MPFNSVVANQYEAALCTLAICVDRCPQDAWNAPVVHLAFCQVAFHTLFFADYYLDENEAAFRTQRFHRENSHVFRDYEELLPRRQRLLYTPPDIRNYLVHCRRKAARVMASESDEMLAARCGFPEREMSRAELHLYNIRHTQHHAAQLILRLRRDFDLDIPWVGSGWSHLPEDWA